MWWKSNCYSFLHILKEFQFPSFSVGKGSFEGEWMSGVCPTELALFSGCLFSMEMNVIVGHAADDCNGPSRTPNRTSDWRNEVEDE